MRGRITEEKKEQSGMTLLYRVRRYLLHEYYIADGYWKDTGAEKAHALLGKHIHNSKVRVFFEPFDSIEMDGAMVVPSRYEHVEDGYACLSCGEVSTTLRGIHIHVTKQHEGQKFAEAQTASVA